MEINHNSPIEAESFIGRFKNDTVKSVINKYNDLPSINTLNEKCREHYFQVVKTMLTKMSMLLNLKEGFTPAQVNVMPELLVGNEFGNLRLNDINLVCRGIVTSKYKIFERMDIETFFRCVREYVASDELIQAREDFHRYKHLSKVEAAETINALPPKTKELLTKEKKTPIPLSEIPQMAFRVTDKESVKKLRTDERE